MKHLRMMAMTEDREKIMRLLSHLGAVEVRETELSDDGLSRTTETDSDKILESLAKIRSARETIVKLGNVKRGMFTPRIQISRSELLSSSRILHAIDAADEINSRAAELAAKNAEKSRLVAFRENLVPWKGLRSPLDCPQGKYFEIRLLTTPSQIPRADIEQAVYAECELSHLEFISEDRELHYVMLICHSSEREKSWDALKNFGAAAVKFRGIQTTAAEKIRETDKKIKEIEFAISELEEKFTSDDKLYDEFLIAEDSLSARLACEAGAEKTAETEKTFLLEGWCPAREEKMLSEFFDANGCAYEFTEPTEDDVPPTLTYNTRMIQPFNVITNMYSPPAYRGIDPNPMMAPFFTLFFGIMLSDAGYGLLLALFGAFALIKLKPRGGFKSFMQLAVICGISTVMWGVLFGGFFGDAIPSIYKLFTGKELGFDTALWFNPMNDPMKMLIFSMLLGGVQIVVSMAIKAYMMIRDGDILGAIFDIGFWWVAIGGGIYAFVGDMKIGLTIALAGAVGLILTQGRAKKNIIMKFFSGVLSLYDVTSYLSDVLSYSRLLALSLSTAVVASVINTMGSLTGVWMFFPIFIFGHLFNIAINLVGSFVHSARLQYVEFFGRFYESGGELFSPLCINTKNVDIIKEEN